MKNIRKILPEDLKRNVTNAIGWKTNRKIVVIESDDWGSIRMPTMEAYSNLIRQGVDVDSYYNRLDSIETEDDLTNLLEILGTFTHKTGKRPVITANFLVANPDFERIKADSFQNYHYEPFTETYKKKPACEKSFDYLRAGIQSEYFRPQFHGREHLNVPVWMKKLQDGDRETLLAFDSNCWGFKRSYSNGTSFRLQRAFNYTDESDEKIYKDVVIEGLQLFEFIFGYRATSFIAPNFVWNDYIEEVLSEHGIRLIQGHRNQLVPINGKPQQFSTRYHYTGQKNSLDQIYLVRNAWFEPASNPTADWVSSCLKEISNAFFWKTPAIISIHRVNFIGALVPENRVRNLRMFLKLLNEIQNRWPMVEFVSSDNLIS